MLSVSDTIIATQGIGKTYGAVPVLREIDLRLRPGAILGLIGENGAGKSTLIKCLNGMTTPTTGTVYFDGKPCRSLTVAGAIACGIVTVPQEFNLVNDLTVAENIFLGQELTSGFGLLRRQEMAAQTQAILNRLNVALEPTQRVGALSVAEKQFVEIAKALTTPCRVLIMDEPTTVLNQREVKALFELLHQLSQQGTAIIFVSHKLHEVRAISSEVAILRDGELVAQALTSELTEADMARRMVGRELNQLFPELPAVPAAEAAPVLEVENMSVPGLLHDISFTLRQGELLGLAGLVGAGRTELAETLYGLRRPSSGTLRLFGRSVRLHSPADAVQAGIAYLSEDRQGAGILTDFALTANITLTSLARYCHPFISRREEQHRAEHFIRRLAIKTASTQTPLRQLSGGNQQKAAIAKGLDHAPKIFLFDEPTRGIDIKAKTDVYRIIHDLLDQGLSGIFISSDLEEVIGLCRRVAVMRSGRIAGFLEDGHITEEEIMYLATGVKA